MTIKPENVSKKIDSLGRITLPKGLRDRMGIDDGQELEISTMVNDGIEYICLSVPIDEMMGKVRLAAKTLEELGIDIPEKLSEMMTE